MSAPSALVVFPGASADRSHRALIALEQGLAPLRVERRDNAPGRSAPKHVTAIAGTVADLCDTLSVGPDRILVGGRSFGGRMCSVAVAEGLAVAGLVLISYPLHPPGKPEKARTEHLAAIDVPTLLVSGTRDAFGTPDELEAAARAVAGPVTHAWIDKGDHGLRNKDAEVVAAVRDWIDATF